MKCETCHGTGTITLPREPGKSFGYLALCGTCRGHGQRQGELDLVGGSTRFRRMSGATVEVGLQAAR